jgi:hypothetical protein
MCCAAQCPQRSQHTVCTAAAAACVRPQDGPTLYLKCSSGGACVSATATLVIVGIYKASGNDAMAAQVSALTEVHLPLPQSYLVAEAVALERALN